MKIFQIISFAYFTLLLLMIVSKSMGYLLLSPLWCNNNIQITWLKMAFFFFQEMVRLDTVTKGTTCIFFQGLCAAPFSYQNLLETFTDKSLPNHLLTYMLLET